MPRQNPDGSANVGMQLWVDLPEKLKMCEPRYRDLKASEIPNIDIDDGKVHIKVISGQSHGVDSVRDLAYTPVWILDVEIKPGGKVTQTLPEGWNAFAYTLNGSTTFGTGEDKTQIGKFHNVVFEQKGDEVQAEVEADADENGHFSKSHSHFAIPRKLCDVRGAKEGVARVTPKVAVMGLPDQRQQAALRTASIQHSQEPKIEDRQDKHPPKPTRA